MKKQKDSNKHLSGARKSARFVGLRNKRRNNKSVSLKGVKPGTMTADDDVMPLYHLDFKKAKPNRFAKRARLAPPVTVGARGGARQGAGRKPSPEPLVQKHVYLTRRHIQRLQRVHKNLSVAIRKLADAQPQDRAAIHPSAALLELCRAYVNLVDHGTPAQQSDERTAAHDAMMEQMEREGIPFNSRWEARWMARYLLAVREKELPLLDQGRHTVLMWAKLPASADPLQFDPLKTGAVVLSTAPFRTEQDEREHYREWIPVVVTLTRAALYDGVTFWRSNDA